MKNKVFPMDIILSYFLWSLNYCLSTSTKLTVLTIFNNKASALNIFKHGVMLGWTLTHWKNLFFPIQIPQCYPFQSGVYKYRVSVMPSTDYHFSKIIRVKTGVLFLNLHFFKGTATHCDHTILLSDSLTPPSQKTSSKYS